jgi:hypothetical protein
MILLLKSQKNDFLSGGKMKKKILAISAVLLFVMSSVAIGGEWVYRKNGIMAGSLADLILADYLIMERQRQTQGSNNLAEGIQSLNQGMQTWIDSMQKRRQERGMQIIAKMIQYDNISMAELFQVIIDHDLDPQTTIQVLKPFLATKNVY